MHLPTPHFTSFTLYIYPHFTSFTLYVPHSPPSLYTSFTLTTSLQNMQMFHRCFMTHKNHNKAATMILTCDCINSTLINGQPWQIILRVYALNLNCRKMLMHFQVITSQACEGIDVAQWKTGKGSVSPYRVCSRMKENILLRLFTRNEN